MAPPPTVTTTTTTTAATTRRAAARVMFFILFFWGSFFFVACGRHKPPAYEKSDFSCAGASPARKVSYFHRHPVVDGREIRTRKSLSTANKNRFGISV